MEQEKINYCSECHVYVDEGLKRCPLCNKNLGGNPEKNELYPNPKLKAVVQKQGFFSELFTFFNCVFIGGSILINIINWNGTPWFLAVVSTLIYMWILFRITLLSDFFVGVKMLFQIGGIMGVFLSFDFLFGGTGWSYEYAFPLVLSIGIAYIDIYSYVHKSRWRENLLCVLTVVAFAFVPFVFYFIGVTHVAWPMAISTFAGGLTILGLLRFAVNFVGSEMKKRFHI